MRRTAQRGAPGLLQHHHHLPLPLPQLLALATLNYKCLAPVPSCCCLLLWWWQREGWGQPGGCWRACWRPAGCFPMLVAQHGALSLQAALRRCCCCVLAWAAAADIRRR